MSGAGKWMRERDFEMSVRQERRHRMALLSPCEAEQFLVHDADAIVVLFALTAHPFQGTLTSPSPTGSVPVLLGGMSRPKLATSRG